MGSLGNFPDPFLAEIAGQPDALRRASDALADQRDTLEQVRAAARGARTLVFTGMGSSYDACRPAVTELAVRGIPALLVDSAELLHFGRSILTADALVTIVSQSGETAEVVKLAATTYPKDGRPSILTITNGLSNPLASRGDLSLDTAAGPETGPSTMTFAASLVHVAAVGRLLSGEDVEAAVRRTRADAEGAAAAIGCLIEEADRLAEQLAHRLGGKDIILVGRGAARAAADMGALLLKETGTLAEALGSAAFRHGPFELAGPDLAVVVIATEPETRSLDVGLAHDLVDQGSAVVLVSLDGDAPEGAMGVSTQFEDRLIGPAVAIVPIQLLAWRLATDHGRVPGAFTRAQKVTTRE